MSKQHFRMLQVERFFRQCRMLLRRRYSFWRQCRTKFRPVDKVETNWTCSICFDLVEVRNFTINVRHCCRLWQQSRTLLRHCCWCGRGLRLASATATVLTVDVARSWTGVPIIMTSDLSALSRRSFSANQRLTSRVQASSVDRPARIVDARMARNSCVSSAYWWCSTPWLVMNWPTGDM